MEQYIRKSAIVAEIEKRIKKYATIDAGNSSELDALYGAKCHALKSVLTFIDTLKVIDPYEQCVQYDSIKAGIQAHAETYSFNIESKLFNQLTKEQQELWRKEIEQACISGAEAGVELARDPRYEENLEAKEIHEDIDKCLRGWSEEDESRMNNLCHFLEEYGNQYYGHLTLQCTISWLKSLRPQNAWKPSDEQMETLELIINSHSLDAYHLGMVQHLYNGLKALKK